MDLILPNINKINKKAILIDKNGNQLYFDLFIYYSYKNGHFLFTNKEGLENIENWILNKENSFELKFYKEFETFKDGLEEDLSYKSSSNINDNIFYNNIKLLSKNSQEDFYILNFIK